ncbi:PleD family two-component system response regulator [Desulforhopalus sp. IMCC35007]|uniref:response regulator n=1 Tax=Desulforhopalus sp. IMCC35007 TaxID=2569543 RepID=UPI00145F7EB1|nr:response regulator [Desulforhopalus sp. IMCC35007]
MDDELAGRLQIKFTLENSGFKTLEAESGEEALESFISESLSLILLDVIMEGIDGVETYRQIRRLPGGKHIPIVIVRALEDEQTIGRPISETEISNVTSS